MDEVLKLMKRFGVEHVEFLRAVLAFVRAEGQLAADVVGGASSDMSEDERHKLELRVAALEIGLLALEQILGELEEKEDDNDSSS